MIRDIIQITASSNKHNIHSNVTLPMSTCERVLIWMTSRIMNVFLVNRHSNERLKCVITQLISNIYSIFVRCRGVVGKSPAFQPGGPGSIPDVVTNFNFYSGTGRVPFVFCPILSPAVALTLYSPHIQGAPPLDMSTFLVNSILLPLPASVSRAFGL